MTRTVPPGSRRLLLALTLGTAVLVTGLLVALSQLGAGHAGSPEELYAGIPQDGTTLGEAEAPVTVSVYEDFQCPFCGRFGREVLPDVVREYVRSGEVRVESRPMAFLGEDSLEAARAALAAAEQDLYWQYHSLLFENQGAENTGYVTDALLERLARQTPGLDPGPWNDLRASGSAGSELEDVRAEAGARGVDSTPTLIVSGPGGDEVLEGARDFEEVAEAIEEARG
ncbi:thioredoxin domain-containing protein [Rubrobacter marinus]|uniref:Thioredoxin domain-containing protein n=1 Tax=Rubrobacter marinus TaxID=2653852 RepID=A0A6G8PYP0_9ACTN|nr:thioredoxin domain-containing protein [Rubrobacter marinus]QIN79300.1 thioredoxin domain-containing protein [Rubrobacter marinus]